MSTKHIEISDLEATDPIDQAHLDECEECRRGWAALRLLRFLSRSVLRVDPPPFFAARVAHLAQERPIPFFFSLQTASRHLAPFFLGLLIITTFLLFSQNGSEDPGATYSDVLFEQPAQAPQEISLEYVLDSLIEVSEDQ
ncbi:MAG: hypothetical protein ACRD1R_11775 [Acidobacteriota bacterium]